MKHERKLRLNLFDAAIILLALAVGALMLYLRFKPAAPVEPNAPASTAGQYTILLQRNLVGTGAQIEPGDSLVEVLRNNTLGTVVSVEVVPATDSVINEETLSYVTAEIPGYEDIYIVVESPIVNNGQSIQVGDGFETRVGSDIYVRGPGYLGSGKVYAIERGA